MRAGFPQNPPMSPFPAIATISAAGLAPGAAGGVLLFQADFAPRDGTYNPQALAPGWNPAKSAGPLRWVRDAARAPESGNGYFAEGTRPAGSNETFFLQSDELEVGDLQGREFRLSFRFQVGPDAGTARGVLDFRALYRTEGGGWQWENLRLFEHGEILGDSGAGLENTFDALSISEPDARGWRTVTVTGEFKADDRMRLWVAPWTFEDANAEAGHFSGTWAIDGVELAASLPEFRHPVAVELHRAVEVEFFGEPGRTYRIESRADGGEWTTETAGIPGEGQLLRRYFSDRNRRYRVVTEP